MSREVLGVGSKKLIEERLRGAGRPLAVHEFNIPGYSENTLATRISEMAAAGVVVGWKRSGKNFKEWSISDGRGQNNGGA